MNKIYKVIWSKARNCYVVVSELAKRNGKCSSSLNKKIIAAFLAAGMTLTYSVVAEAVGAADTDAINVAQLKTASALTTDNRNVGLLVNANGVREITSPYIHVQGVEEATAAQEFIQNNPDRNLYAGTSRTKQVEWDRQYNLANSYASATGNYAIAVGAYATTGRNATLDEAQIGAYNALQQTIKNDAAFANEDAVQNATNYTDLVNALSSVGTAAANNYITRLNNQVTTRQNQAPTSTNAIAVGNAATAGGTSAIAVGNSAKSLKVDGTAANYAIAVGDNAKAANTYAIAVGNSSSARDMNAIAVGNYATTGRNATLAEARIEAYSALRRVIKSDAAFVNNDAVQDTTSYAELVDALNSAGGDAANNYITQLNNRVATLQNQAPTSTNAIAAGYNANAGGIDAIAVGNNAKAQAEDGTAANAAIAVGQRAQARAHNAIAVGAGARTVTSNSVAIGYNAGIARGVSTRNATPIGEEGGNAIAIGVNATNFTYGTANAVGYTYYANIQNSIAIGYKAHTHGAYAFAIGVSTDASAERSFAIGTTSTNITDVHSGARSAGQGSLTFGDQAMVVTPELYKPSSPGDAENRSTDIMVNDAMAIGTNSMSMARNAVALGGGMSYTYHDISADKTTMTNITKYYSHDGKEGKWVDRADGTGAYIGLKADGAVAIGGATGKVDLEGNNNLWPTKALSDNSVTEYTKAAQATVARSVALGTGSVANREAMKRMDENGMDEKPPTYVTSGYDASTGKAYAGKDQDSAVWKSTLGAFSIGEETDLSKDDNGNITSTAVNTRQITGVAAGSADTDAVNVAQLKRVASSVDAVNLKFSANAGGVKSNASGSIVNVVGSAAKKGHTYSADNVTTVITQDASGNSTITVKMDDNPSFTSVTTGNTKIDNNGLTITGGPSITKTNVTMGGNQIHNVAAGSKDTDAVNVAQLKGQQWRIGIGADGGTGGTNGKENKNALALTAVTEDKRDVQFLAGAGIDISSTSTLEPDSNGFGVTISSRFMEAEIDKENGTINNITYDGVRYSLGDASAVRNVVSDKRAVVVENQGINREIVSPYIHINGLEDEDLNSANFAKATADGAIAIGQHSEAKAENTLAVGHNADADGMKSTAIGYNSHAHGPNSVSIGVAATSSGNRAIAIGTSATNDSDPEYNPSNPHQGARAAGQGSVVLGDRARALSTVYQSDTNAIGHPDTNVNDAIAIGTKAEVRAKNAIALGSDLSYTDENSTTTMYGSANDGRAYGATVGDGADSGIAIGGAYGTVKDGKIAQEMEAASTYGIRGIAIGTGAMVADPDDFKKLKDLQSSSEYKKALNEFQEARSVYMETKTAYDTIKDVDVQGKENMALPVGMRVTELAQKEAKDAFDAATAKLKEVTPAYKEQITKKLVLEAQDSVDQQDAVAIGTKANAAVRDSVALGSHSVTNEDDRAGIRTGQTGYDVQTGKSYENDGDAGTPAWRSTAGSVSVGGGLITITGQDGTPEEVQVTRRISNVAAGVSDTDAVNVAQLKRAAIFQTDSRNTSLAVDEEGYMSIDSPYLHIAGVKEAAEAKSIINQYGSIDKYENALTEEITDIQTQITTTTSGISELSNKINKLTDEINASSKSSSIDTESVVSKTVERSELTDQKDILELKLKKLKTALGSKTEELNKVKVDRNRISSLQEYLDSEAKATGEKSMALGYKANASEEESLAVGANNTVSGKQSLGIGSSNTVSGEKSIAIGTGNEVYGDGSGAIGDPNIVNADNSYTVGNNSNIAAGQTDVFAFGNDITKTNSNSVFLGSKSGFVKEGKTTAGMSDYSSANIDGRNLHFAGGKPTGVVSVGNEKETRRIQNVAAGKISADSTDAINGSQLYGAMNQTANQITGVENRMKKGLAGAAALAALHPMDFDPDDKLTFAAGMGHYRGESAAALGMFYRPDEKVMFSLGGTLGNGENMINAGVSFSLDRTPRVTGSRTALTKEVVALREHVAKQDAQIAELTALVRQLAGNAGLQVPASSALPTEGPALFADNLDNKWVYDAIEDLEQRGYIHGYAGRELTRDELAAAFDRAMAGGATLDERIVKEFEPELSHVRLAHVEGKGNNEGEWYERPRASHDKLEDKHKIEKKPFRVEEKKATSKS